MCFSITLRIPKDAGMRAPRQLASLGPLHVEGGVGDDDFFYARITEDHTCGCSMLDPVSDMDGDLWRLAPAIPTKLAEMLRGVAGAVACDFHVLAVFSEDLPVRELSVDLAGMLGVVNANRLQDRTNYRVAVSP